MLNNNHKTLKTFPTVPWPKIAHSDLGKLFLLGRVMQEGNAIHLSIEGIAAVLSLSENRAYQFIQRMAKANVMKRHGRFLYINPLYLFVGKYMSRELYLLFKAPLDRVLPAWVIQEFKESDLK